MFVAVAFVEFVCALADYVGTARHVFAAVLARPIFRGGQQPRARSQATLAFRANQPVYFRADFAFKKHVSAHVQPADHSVFYGIRNKYGVLRRGLDSLQSFADLCSSRRISKLACQRCKLRRIGSPGPSYFQLFIFSQARSLIHAVFLRSRFCTASLFNSRSASAAIQRAERELCWRILSAARIASRLRRRFLFPIFLKAQFTAFFTKLRSSCASRSITCGNRPNRSSCAALSL